MYILYNKLFLDTDREAQTCFRRHRHSSYFSIFIVEGLKAVFNTDEEGPKTSVFHLASPYGTTTRRHLTVAPTHDVTVALPTRQCFKILPFRFQRVGLLRGCPRLMLL